MFSLIITIISVALVAILAIAALYYGGSSFNDGTVKAQAAQLIVEGQQIEGAVTIFYSDNERYPTDLNELVSSGYLTSIPDGTVAMLTPSSGVALAASAGWVTPTSGQPTYEISAPVTDAVCEAVNQTSLGSNGIPAQAYASYSTQCYYSATAQADLVVVTLSGTGTSTGLANSLPPIDVAPPSAVAPWAGGPISGWQVPPSVPSNGSGPGSTSSSSTGGSDSSSSGSTASSATPVSSGLTWSQLSVNLGTVATGQTSNPVTVSLVNNSTTTIDLYNTNWNTPPDLSVSYGCSEFLAPGQSCPMQLSLNALTPGPASGDFTISQGSLVSDSLLITGTVTGQPLVQTVTMSLSSYWANGNQTGSLLNSSIQLLVINWLNDTGQAISTMQLDADWFSNSNIHASMGSCGSVSAATPLLPGQSCTVSMGITTTPVQEMQNMDYIFVGSGPGQWQYGGQELILQ